MTTRPLILLVDDEPDILVALGDLLEDRYDILTFTSPAEALDRLAREPELAVIVSDQRMPEMTGDAFLTAARRVSEAEAVLLTGYADLNAVTAALNSGGIVGYAPKPWEPDALRAMIAGAAERFSLKRDLRLHRALLEGLMENVPAAVSFKDANGRFIALNSRKAEALGIEAGATRVGGRNITSDAPGPSKIERRALSQGEVVQTIVESQSDNGSAWLETTCIPTRDGAAALILIERDVTAQKIAEQQLRQSDKLRALGTLAGGVAHDFNNLLTAILGSLELASRRLPDEERVRRYLDNATLAARRGASLTQRLLGFSRQTDGDACVTDIAAILRDMGDLVTRTLGGSTSVDWDLAPDLWSSLVEPDQLEMAVLNLCINARDAMGDGGRITVRGRNLRLAGLVNAPDLSPGDYVAVSIEDHGEGIRPEVLSRVLEPFFTTKPVGKGTGLGLPMAYGFAQRSGGALDIESELGVGTKVTLYLPRSEDAGETASDPDAEKAPEVVSPPLDILVVDDETSVRQVTAGLLRDQGHTVMEALDGADALSQLAKGLRPSLAIVDFAMPGMNGAELIRRIEPLGLDIPVLLLTGYADLDSVPDGVPMIAKPFTVEQLANAVRQYGVRSPSSVDAN